MSNQDYHDRPQRVATPAFLHQRLLSFRIGKADKQSYVLRDNIRGQSYDFQPWQFFVLEVLPGCTDDAKLSSVFQDRFGVPLEARDRDMFFASLADAGLFNEAAASHPLLTRFGRKTYVVEGERAKTQLYRAKVAEEWSQPPAAGAVMKGGTVPPGTVPFPVMGAMGPAVGQAAMHPGASASATMPAASAVRPAPPTGPHNKAPYDDETLPAGMQGAPDFDPRASKWMWVMFNPTGLLKLASPVLSPLRLLIFVLPLALLGALNLVTRNLEAVEGDLERLLEGFNLVEHWVISLVTVNLLVTITTAVLAFRYRANVSGFGIALIMRFYPRFATRISHLDQLSRVERMWLHGAPLLVRLFLFCAGIFVWFGSRTAYEQLPAIALAMSMTAAASFLFSANPLIKSNGYHLLSAFTNEPHLRGKAFKALLNKARGGSFKEANELLLATYAISMAAFMFVLVVGAASFIGFALHQIYLGGSAIIVACIIGILLARRVFNYFGRVEAAYDRSLQFDRWRKRTHGQDEPKPEDAPPATGFASYVWKAALLMLFVALFLPYEYASGGPFEVHPPAQQVISTDVNGRVEDVFFEGTEVVAKGTIVARLASTEEQAQANIFEMKMMEQQATIDHLKSLPRKEEVQLARMALQIEETRVEFSKLQLNRIKKLVDQSFAPVEELDNSRRQLEVDKMSRSEKRAALEVAKLGPTEFEIAAAEAKWESLKAERDAYLDRVRRADLIMPFDGRLLTQYLKEKENSYYKSGDVFAAVEAGGSMTAEVEVPESETEYLELGSVVEFKPIAYSSEVFTGTVVHVDWDITERTFGNVIKVIVQLDDEDGRLRNGMTGYAKIEGPTMPVWEAFSRQIIRFVEVQVWSWIP